MKRIAWILLGWFVLLSAEDACALDQEIIVTISPAFQEQMQKSSPGERKRMRAAIKAGNKFIPQHLDGAAYDQPQAEDKQAYKKWMKNIRPLINKDMKDWYTDTEVQANSASTVEINGQKTNHLAVCPQAELVSINVADEHFDAGWKTYYPLKFTDDSFVLKYRTKVSGVWIYSGNSGRDLEDFLSDKNNDFEDVLISLDKNNKISQVIPQYDAQAWISKRIVDIMKQQIRHPFVFMDETQADRDARTIKYKKLIQKVASEEAMVCEGAQAKPR